MFINCWYISLVKQRYTELLVQVHCLHPSPYKSHLLYVNTCTNWSGKEKRVISGTDVTNCGGWEESVVVARRKDRGITVNILSLTRLQTLAHALRSIVQRSYCYQKECKVERTVTLHACGKRHVSVGNILVLSLEFPQVLFFTRRTDPALGLSWVLFSPSWLMLG